MKEIQEIIEKQKEKLNEKLNEKRDEIFLQFLKNLWLKINKEHNKISVKSTNEKVYVEKRVMVHKEPSESNYVPITILEFYSKEGRKISSFWFLEVIENDFKNNPASSTRTLTPIIWDMVNDYREVK